jgi:hypothetical protein
MPVNMLLMGDVRFRMSDGGWTIGVEFVAIRPCQGWMISSSARQTHGMHVVVLFHPPSAIDHPP